MLRARARHTTSTAPLCTAEEKARPPPRSALSNPAPRLPPPVPWHLSPPGCHQQRPGLLWLPRRKTKKNRNAQPLARYPAQKNTPRPLPAHIPTQVRRRRWCAPPRRASGTRQRAGRTVDRRRRGMPHRRRACPRQCTAFRACGRHVLTCSSPATLLSAAVHPRRRPPALLRCCRPPTLPPTRVVHTQ